MDGDPAGGNGVGYKVQEFTRAFQLACAGTAALSSSHNTHFFQNIEGYNIAHLGWGTVSAKPVTLSFWVKTNVTGIFAVGLENSATDRCCIRDYQQNGNFRWNKVVLTFPGCPDGTWLQTNGTGMRVRFCLASGVTYDDGIDGVWITTDELCTTKSQVVNFMDSTNNRFMITGVQLEEGTVATPFEHRSYTDELELCQRYYEAVYMTDGTAMFKSYASYGGSANFEMQFKVDKRATPTWSLEGNASWSGATPNAFESRSGAIFQHNAGTQFALGDAHDDLCGSFSCEL